MTGILAAAALAGSLCFDFQSGKLTPLSTPLTLSEGRATSSHGRKDPDMAWGAARGLLARKPSEVYQWVRDPKHWKDPKKTEMTVVEAVRPGLDYFFAMDLEVHVFAFFTVSWKEEWGFRIVEGTREKPKAFQVAYQKVAGTSHIQSLCGWVEGRESSGGGTDLFLYEQANAARYGPEDIEKMHLDNLAALSRPDPSPSR